MVNSPGKTREKPSFQGVKKALPRPQFTIGLPSQKKRSERKSGGPIFAKKGGRKGKSASNEVGVPRGGGRSKRCYAAPKGEREISLWSTPRYKGKAIEAPNTSGPEGGGF